MFRLRGLSELIRNLASPAVTELFALLTYLGDPLILLVVVAVYYWFSDDRRGPALLITVTLAAVAVTVLLKHGFARPRPPVDLWVVSPNPDSYGFPSGHTIGATVVYGGIAALDRRYRRRKAVAGLAALTLLIGLSRVVVGVHYLGDVLVGYAIGLVLLGWLWLTDERRRLRVAVAATAIAVPGVLVVHGGTEGQFVLGACLGAVAVLSTVDTGSFPTSGHSLRSIALAGTGLLVIAAAYELALAAGRPLVVVAAGAFTSGVTFGLPAVLDGDGRVGTL